jgi:membrane protein implicated in regulation of membrane protease activity
MSQENNGKVYPVRSLHEFLYELDKEWSKFRNGSLVTIISSAITLGIILWLIIVIRRIGGAAPIEFLFLFAVIALLGYSIYAAYSQYRFFNKWERRVGLLLHLEDELAADKLAEKSKA